MFEDIFEPLLDDFKDEEEKEESWDTGQGEDFWRSNSMEGVWNTKD